MRRSMFDDEWFHDPEDVLPLEGFFTPAAARRQRGERERRWHPEASRHHAQVHIEEHVEENTSNEEEEEPTSSPAKRKPSKQRSQQPLERQTSDPIVHEPDDPAATINPSRSPSPPPQSTSNATRRQQRTGESSDRRRRQQRHHTRRHTDSSNRTHVHPLGIPFGFGSMFGGLGMFDDDDDDFGFGFGFGDPFARASHRQRRRHQHRHSDPFQIMDDMMNRMMTSMHAGFGADALMGAGNLERLMGEVGSVDSSPAAASSYCFSSSTVQMRGSDNQPIVRQQVKEKKRVGDLAESYSVYSDSFGNERVAMKRGLSDRARELVKERNYRGEERTAQNLRHLKPEEVHDFDAQWEAMRREVDPHHRLMGKRSAALGHSVSRLPTGPPGGPEASRSHSRTHSSNDQRLQLSV